MTIPCSSGCLDSWKNRVHVEVFVGYNPTVLERLRHRTACLHVIISAAEDVNAQQGGQLSSLLCVRLRRGLLTEGAERFFCDASEW